MEEMFDFELIPQGTFATKVVITMTAAFWTKYDAQVGRIPDYPIKKEGVQASVDLMIYHASKETPTNIQQVFDIFRNSGLVFAPGFSNHGGLDGFGMEFENELFLYSQEVKLFDIYKTAKDRGNTHAIQNPHCIVKFDRIELDFCRKMLDIVGNLTVKKIFISLEDVVILFNNIATKEYSVLEYERIHGFSQSSSQDIICKQSEQNSLDSLNDLIKNNSCITNIEVQCQRIRPPNAWHNFLGYKYLLYFDDRLIYSVNLDKSIEMYQKIISDNDDVPYIKQLIQEMQEFKSQERKQSTLNSVSSLFVQEQKTKHTSYDTFAEGSISVYNVGVTMLKAKIN